MNYIFHQSQCVGMSCMTAAWMPYFSSLGGKDIFWQNFRQLSSLQRLHRYIEKLEEVTLIFGKYQSTLLPIILSGDKL